MEGDGVPAESNAAAAAGAMTRVGSMASHANPPSA
jgi:hypothetical protein